MRYTGMYVRTLGHNISSVVVPNKCSYTGMYVRTSGHKIHLLNCVKQMQWYVCMYVKALWATKYIVAKCVQQMQWDVCMYVKAL
jgi:hypothetical protein